MHWWSGVQLAWTSGGQSASDSWCSEEASWGRSEGAGPRGRSEGVPLRTSGWSELLPAPTRGAGRETLHQACPPFVRAFLRTIPKLSSGWSEGAGLPTLPAFPHPATLDPTSHGGGRRDTFFRQCGRVYGVHTT